ncbi:MAG: hypothetical protein Q8R00_01015 [Candidatus Nanoarchaeia archaeon]|nr:hypothetical protein [Candidatus Nanoarchaeia archaeon]
MNKNGQGAIIAWILLIGLTVSLAVMVTTWTRQQAEETTSGLVSQTEVDLRCESVSFNANPSCDSLDGEIKIVNRGDFSIHKLVFHIKDRDDGTLKSKTINLFESGRTPISPGESQTIYTQTGLRRSDIDITPFIKVEDQYAGCSSRKITVICEK